MTRLHHAGMGSHRYSCRLRCKHVERNVSSSRAAEGTSLAESAALIWSGRVNTKRVCKVDEFYHDLNAFVLSQMVADAAEALDDIITQWEVICVLLNPYDLKIYSDIPLSAS
jgi:hypothetical protein